MNRHPIQDHVPQDGIALMERAVRVGVCIVLIAALIVWALTLVGCGPSDVDVTAAQVAAADERKANVPLPEKLDVYLWMHGRLSHPLACDATINGACYVSTRARDVAQGGGE